MAKDQPAQPLPTAPALTLTEFCARLSETVKSPELIGAFEFTQKRDGHVKDTAEAFRARYDAFVNTPV